MTGKTKAGLKENRVNEKGYTLIIAVIIMAVLLIVGTAVLTAAANSLNTVNRRVEGRQTYYVAKSAMNVIDQSMQGDALGQAIRSRAFADLSSEAKDEDGIAKLSDQEISVGSVSLEGNDLKNFAIEDLKVQYTGQMQTLAEGKKEGHILDLIVTVSFAAASGTDTYRISADYKYSGRVVISSGKTAWGKEEWELTNVSQ